jgi:excisionase family DNA binding protein
MDDTQNKGLVRISDAAAFLAVSRSKLYSLMEDGQLRYVKLGRSRRIPREALNDLAERHMVSRDTGTDG